MDDIDFKLIDACEDGNLHYARHLVEHSDPSANIHRYSDLALRKAAEKGHLHIVKYLIKCGADVHVKEDLTLLLAAKYGHLDIVKYLIKNVPPPQADIKNAYTGAFYWAVMGGQIHIVKYMLEQHGFEQNETGSMLIDIHSYYNYALETAAVYDYADIIKYLIKYSYNGGGEYSEAEIDKINLNCEKVDIKKIWLKYKSGCRTKACKRSDQF